MKHLILTGTDAEVDSCTRLHDIVEAAQALTIVNWLSKSTIEKAFNVNNFSVATDLILVYLNNRDFSFNEFYLFQKSSPTLKNLQFVFICAADPFDTITPITASFEVVNIVKDNVIKTAAIPGLSLIRLDNKISAILEMISSTKDCDAFDRDEKKLFTTYFKKQLLRAQQTRLDYVNYTTKDIIDQIKPA